MILNIKNNIKALIIYTIIGIVFLGTVVHASTITTILGTDTITSSRATINTNFSNLNTDKLESGDSSSALTVNILTVDSIVATSTTATSTINQLWAGILQIGSFLDLPYFNATSTTATSTIAGGLNISGGGLTVGTIPNCDTVDTDANGNFICGTDATGGGGGTGTVSTSTNETAGNLPYWTSTSGTPATLGEVATTSATIGSGLSYSGTFGSLVGGASGTLTLDNTGAWAGTYTNFGSDFWTFFNATTTDFLTEGSSNLYNQTHTGEVTGSVALTLADSVAVTSWNLTTPTLTSHYGTPCSGQNFLQDISDTGVFSCGLATGGGGGAASDVWATTTGQGGAGDTELIIPQDTTQDFIVGASASTSAPFYFDVSAGTLQVGSGGAGTSTTQFNDDDNAWTIGTGDDNKAWRLASSTDLADATTIWSVAKTGTTTASNGFDLTAGCFSINGTCVTGGGGSSNWVDNGTYLTTLGGEFIDVSHYVATSTTATSTFAGGLTIDTDWSYDPDGKFQRFGIEPAVEVFGSARVRFTDENGGNSDWSFNVANGAWGSVAFGASNGTLSSPTISTDGNVVGAINFLGYDGSAFRKTASIVSQVNGALGASDMPGSLGFNTTPDEATNPLRAMTIIEDGNVGIGTTSPYAKLSVVGETVSEFFTATSTTATSTFTGIQWDYATSSAEDLTLARIGDSTYSTVQDMQTLFHSSGVTTGGTLTDDADGTITVSAGTGFIRPSNDKLSILYYFDWSAEAGANVALVDNDMNYIYVEYNSGTPQVVATISKRTEEHTNLLLGTIYRSGTELHITENTRALVGDHALNMLIRMRETQPFQRVSGGVVSETGTRNYAVTAGDWWEALTNFTTVSFDSSTADIFTYYYSDGAGGFTEVATQSVIDNLQYDDGDGGLGTLSNNRYGVHWLYLAADDEHYVVYGTTDGTLTTAQDAGIPANVPPHFDESHAKLIGKVIILKSASSFTSIQSTFNGQFSLESASDHGGLIGLGDDDHTQYILVDGTRAFSGSQALGDNSLTGIDTLTFTDTAGTIAGIANGNLLDLSATEIITGLYSFTNAGTTTIANLWTENLQVGTLFETPIFNATSTSATSTIAWGLDVANINQTGSATSTFATGIDLTDGCFSILGVCIGGAGAETNSLEVTITGIENTEIFIGTGSNTGNFAVLSSDITMDNAGAVTIANNAVALGTDTTGNYVLDVADGTGIDGTCSSEGCTYTPTLDLTEINSTTFGSGTFTTLTFDAGAVDPVWTYASGIANLSTGSLGIASSTPWGMLGVSGTTTTEGFIADVPMWTGTSTLSHGDIGTPFCSDYRDSDDAGWTRVYYLDGAQIVETGQCEI